MTMSLAEAASADDQRSPMAALIPSQTVCGDKVPTIEFEPADPAVMMLWLGVANSLALDFVVGMKVSLKMSMSLMASLAFPRRVSSDDATARACACARAARLSCAGPQMLDLLRTVERLPALAGLDLTSSNDQEERDRLAAELDVVVTRDLFGLTGEEMQYLLEPRDMLGADCAVETSAALRRAEKIGLGGYRTRRLVLEAWDRTTAAAGTLGRQEPTTC
jgi:hypothetical protein